MDGTSLRACLPLRPEPWKVEAWVRALKYTERQKDENRKEAVEAASLRDLSLLQQFKYELLLLVCLGKSGDSGLFQN